jgi:hypothetical protein
VAQPAETIEVRQGDSVYYRKDELIVKQCCIKAAARFCAGVIQPSNVVPGKKMADAVCDVAEVFYAWITGMDELPEETEPTNDNGEEGE